MGSCGQRQRIFAAMGHVRRSREGPSVRLWSFRCGPVVLLNQQSHLFAQLQVDVVSGDKEVLSANTCTARWMQE